MILERWAKTQLNVWSMFEVGTCYYDYRIILDAIIIVWINVLTLTIYNVTIFWNTLN